MADQDPRARLPPVLGGRYRVLGEIGRGSMGRVLRVEHLNTGQTLAMKVLRSQLGDSALERFRREARATAQLDSRHIVRVTDADVAPELDNAPFLVMELLDGEDLATVTARRGPLPAEEVLAIIGQIARGLHQVHRAGLVHRDLKPANVFLHRQEDETVVKLLDFGLVKQQLAGDPHSTSVTQDGALLGTPAYMSPEQVLADHQRVGPASDLWSLGMMAFHMLTGGVSYWDVGGLAELILAIRGAPMPPPSTRSPLLTAAFDEWFARSCHRRAAWRWPDALQQWRALAPALDLPATERPLSLALLPPAAAEGVAPRPPASPATREESAGSLAESAPERRQVTVLFYGFVPADQATIDMDPEDFPGLEAEFQAALDAALGDLGQTSQQTAQGGRFVFFGHPKAYGDDAWRALESGLRIRQAIRGLSRSRREEGRHALSLRVGAHTGLVLARKSLEEGVPPDLVGPALGVAADLVHDAAAGQFLVSASTARLLEGRFVGAPIRADENAPVGVEGLPDALGTLDELEGSSMVGRRAELSILETALEDVEEGTRRTVLLTGEPGIGKSRLIRALHDAVAEGATRWRRAQCSPYFQQSAFHPFAALLADVLAVPQSGPGDAISAAAIEAGLTAPAADRLRELMGHPPRDLVAAQAMSPQLLREQAIAAVIDLLRADAADAPMVLVFEDIHWADPSTLEILDRLAIVDDVRIFTVMTARPEFDGAWSTPRTITPVALRKLSAKQSARVVSSRLGTMNLPEEAIGDLVRRADGVPLFIEELSRLIADLAPEGEATLLSAVGAAPSTLRESLLARLDSLGDARALAQLGAVLGQEFSASDLRTVWAGDPERLGTQLERLVHADVLVQQGASDKTSYAFRHALVRDAAYDSLPRATRQKMHAQVGGTLMRHPSPPPPELLAHHFSEGGMPREAAGLLFQAGQQALARSANHEALAHFQSGIEQLDRLEKTPADHVLDITFWTMKGMAWVVSRGYGLPEVREAFDGAMERVRALGDVEVPELVPALWGQWVYALVRGQFTVAAEHSARLLRLAEKLPDPGIRMLALLAHGTTCHGAGAFAEAIEHLEAGLALYDPQAHAGYRMMYGQDPRMLGQVFLAWALWCSGRPDAAKSVVDEAVAHSETLNHPNSLGFALALSALVHHYRGDMEEVRARAEALMALSTEQGWIQWTGHARLWGGAAQVAGGQIDEGLAAMREGREFAGMAGERSGMTHYEAVLADALVQAGRLDEAAERIALAWAGTEGGEQAFTAELDRLSGLIAWRRGDEAEAARLLASATERARGLGARSYELRALTEQARFEAETGRDGHARERLGQVHATMDEGRETRDWQRAAALLAE